VTERIGVYICHCGGNISDFVDVEQVREEVREDPGVVVARTHIFTCSDAAQQEIIEDIQKERLDGLVVASCSPKLHLHTFRSMAERAGLNPYQYVQVNLREQCSWAHRNAKDQATEKAVRLVRGGISKCRLSESLEALRIETTPKVLVVGGGAAGLRTAIALADLGLFVYVVEKAARVGGWTGRWGRMFPHNRLGSEIIRDLEEQVKARKNITCFTDATLVEKSGNVGDFRVTVSLAGNESVSLDVGAIIVATGFDIYQPELGEFGNGQTGVLLLDEFREMVDKSNGGELKYLGRAIKDIVYVYCVGSRQRSNVDHPNLYCSRYCCSAAVHTALCVFGKDPEIHQFHLFRDMRTYGKYELLYEEACRKGSAFLSYHEDKPPSVEPVEGKLRVKVQDELLGGEQIEIDADLVVLVTGMVPRRNEELLDVLKLPVGRDGFFNEIHPKLRPVETVIDGVYIAGAAQGPKNLPESIASALSAASKSAALLKRGYVDLEPYVAEIDLNRCDGCWECLDVCPYGAIEKLSMEDRQVAQVNASLCKGSGACVPSCPAGAIDLVGYSDAQIRAMIEAFS
jgi:heterodisulfide reductase subunit A